VGDLLSVAVGTANACLLERAHFRGKSALSLLMLVPLVIPGVILGISILAFASRLAQLADDSSAGRSSSCVPDCRSSCWGSSRTSCRSPR
jgi:ABC-type spermidine/putrescine transport system permease subunit II